MIKVKKIIGPGIAAASIALAAWGGVKLYRVTTTTPEATIPSTAVKRGEYLLKISEETLKDTEGEAEKGRGSTLQILQIYSIAPRDRVSQI